MDNKKQVILIGGGFSIKPELEKLQTILKNKFVIGLNYAYKYFPYCTFYSYVDHLFYSKELEGLKNLPLIIGNYHQNLIYKKKNNTIMLPTITIYSKNIRRGVYKASLVGIYALTLAIYLLDVGEVFLLGYDLGGKNDNKDKDKGGRIITHFYQSTEKGSVQHEGIGKISYYRDSRRGHNDFGSFRDLEGIKIYNVGLESKLEEFEKIDYSMFYKKLNKEDLNQDKLREDIKKKLIF